MLYSLRFLLFIIEKFANRKSLCVSILRWMTYLGLIQIFFLGLLHTRLLGVPCCFLLLILD